MGQKSTENAHTCSWNWLMKILGTLMREDPGDRGTSASQKGCWVGANQSWKGPRGCISEFGFGYSYRKRWCCIILNTTAPGQLNEAGKMLREICVQVNLERGSWHDHEDGSSSVIGLSKIKWQWRWLKGQLLWTTGEPELRDWAQPPWVRRGPAKKSWEEGETV